MAAFVAGFANFFGASIAGATGFGATLGAAFAAATFNAALGAISRKFMSKKESPSGRGQQRDVTVQATDAYDVFVYGRALVGGVTVYHNGIPDGSGVNNRMHHVVKWAGHECASIELFRLDDRTLDPATSSIDWSPRSYNFVGDNGLVQAGEFRGVTTASGPTYMRWYLGDQKSADLRLVGQADEWTTAHIGRGQTYGILEIWQVDEQDQTSKVFQKSNGAGPGNIAALLHGKKIYDHRRYALNRDPGFRDIASYWFHNNAATVSGTASALNDGWRIVDGIGGINDFGAVHSGSTADDHWLISDIFPVHPNSTYTATVKGRDQHGNRVVDTTVMQFMDDGELISRLTWASTTFPAEWSEFVGTFGNGQSVALSTSARYARVGVVIGAGSATNLQLQDCRMYLGTGSAHLVNVSSTWEYSESPPFCVADYLTDEKLGFGKRLRMPVNPSRYAKNGDPTWRKRSSLDVVSYWSTSPNSEFGNPISTIGASLTIIAGAPLGRRALAFVTSDGSQAGGDIHSRGAPVDPSGAYYCTVQARQEGNRTCRVSAFYQDINGDVISETIFVSSLSSIWSKYSIAVGSGTGNSIPSSARHIALKLYAPASGPSGGDATTAFYQDARIMVGTQDRHFIEPHEQIFWPSVSSAAAYTDALVATPSGTQVRFACNGAGHTGRGHRENIRDLLSSFNGRAVYVQSGFWITAGWEEPTKTLNKSDFRNGAALKIRAQAEREDRYNHVRGTFFDPVQEFKSVPFATVTADEYIARDSSQQLFHDLNLPFTNDWFMAQRVAFGVLEQGDNQQLVEFQLKHSALDLMPGRVVGITHDVVSWTNHTLRMVDMRTDLKKGVTLFGREDYQASYVDVGTSEYFARNFTGVSSHAPRVPQVSSVTASPRINGVQLRWVNPAARAFEYVDIYRRATNAFSGSVLIKSTRNDEYFDPIATGSMGITNYYWFRTRDFANNVSSVFPGLTTSFFATPNLPVAQDPEYVFLEEFRYENIEQFEEQWERGSLTGGNASISFPGSGTLGGKVIRANSGEARYTSKTRIPYDPQALYQMTVKTRMTTSHSFRAQYFGFAGYRADGTTSIATDSSEALGSQHYFVRQNHSPSSLNVWDEHVGHVRGYMPWPASGTVNANISQDPKLAARMHDLVRYVSPHFILNFFGAGTQEIDYISVRKIVPRGALVFDPQVTLESNWLVMSGVGSRDLVNGTVVDFRGQSVHGEFNVIALPVSASISQTAFLERARPEYHDFFTHTNTITFNWRAQVYVESRDTFVTVAPYVALYTRSGSGAQFHTATGQVFGLASSGWTPFDAWQGINLPITVSPGFINQNSFPPPYFISVGATISFTGAVGTVKAYFAEIGANYS